MQHNTAYTTSHIGSLPISKCFIFFVDRDISCQIHTLRFKLPQLIEIVGSLQVKYGFLRKMTNE